MHLRCGAIDIWKTIWVLPALLSLILAPMKSILSAVTLEKRVLWSALSTLVSYFGSSGFGLHLASWASDGTTISRGMAMAAGRWSC